MVRDAGFEPAIPSNPFSNQQSIDKSTNKNIKSLTG
jgi:hypothetical protein